MKRWLLVLIAFTSLSGISSWAQSTPVIINEFRRDGGTLINSEYIEFLVVSNLTLAELNTFFFGDSQAATSSKLGSFRFNLAAPANIPAGTIISVGGTTNVPAEDLAFNPAMNDWNLTFQIGGASIVTINGSGDFAGTDVAWIDTTTNGVTSLHSINWDASPGAFGSNTTVTIGAPANGTNVAYIGGDIPGITNPANYEIVHPGTLGQPNGGNNTTFVNLLRSALSGGSTNYALFVSPATVSEGNGTTNVIATITRSGDTNVPSTITLLATNGTATPGVDYTSTNITVNFAMNQTTTNISIEILGDMVAEMPINETFEVILTNTPMGANVSSPFTVTIQDDDNPPAITFSTNAYSAFENAGTVNVLIQRTGNLTFTPSVTAIAVPGTATTNDFTPVTNTFTFAVGQAFTNFVITLLTDGVTDGPKTVNLILTNFVTANLGTFTNAVLTINDVDIAPALLFHEPFNYTIGNSLTNQPDWASIAAGDDIIIKAGNLAVAGLSNSTGNSVSFGGTGSDAARVFPIQVVDTWFSFPLRVDSLGGLFDGTGGYFAGLADSTSTFGSTVWLRETNGGYNVGISHRSNSQVAWDNTIFGTNQTVFVVGNYVFNAGSTSNNIANLWINPATNTFGAGAAPVPSLTATNGNDLVQIQRFFLRQDSGNETPEELTIDEVRVGASWALVTPPGEGLGGGGGGTNISFSAATYNITEANVDTNVTLTVVRNGPVGTPIVFTYVTANGTATAPDDYTAVNPAQQVTMGANVISTNLSIVIKGDNIPEPPQSFTVTLAVVSGATLGAPSTATVNITDDDMVVVGNTNVIIISGGGNVSETNNGGITLTVSRLVTDSNLFNVNYSLSGSAVSNVDYTITPSVLAFGSNTLFKTLTITPINDTELESAETVVAGLLAGTGYEVTNPATAQVTIVDDDLVGGLPGDFNADGFSDILMQKKSTVTLLTGSSNGYTVAGNIALTANNQKVAAANNAKGTNYLALKVGNKVGVEGYNSSLASVFSFAPIKLPKLAGTKPLASGDLNNDGVIDLITVKKKNANVVFGPDYATFSAISGVGEASKLPGKIVGLYVDGTTNVLVFQKGKKSTTLATLSGASNTISATTVPGFVPSGKILGFSGKNPIYLKKGVVSAGGMSYTNKPAVNNLGKVVGPK